MPITLLLCFLWRVLRFWHLRIPALYWKKYVIGGILLTWVNVVAVKMLPVPVGAPAVGIHPAFAPRPCFPRAMPSQHLSSRMLEQACSWETCSPPAVLLNFPSTAQWSRKLPPNPSSLLPAGQTCIMMWCPCRLLPAFSHSHFLSFPSKICAYFIPFNPLLGSAASKTRPTKWDG